MMLKNIIKMRLKKSFFTRDTLLVAEELLGKVLVYKTKNGIIKGIINETEAYTQEDESCHAFDGKVTKRNEVMFRCGGHLYIYFTYGMYYCSNIITEKKGQGCAVLLRSVIPLKGIDLMMKNRKSKSKETKNLVNGPAKLCMAYGFNKQYNGINTIDKDSKIYVEDLGFTPKNIQKTKRIGISKATQLDWRFICNDFI
jgi:DNA-3-methyladenine glycosylase